MYTLHLTTVERATFLDFMNDSILHLYLSLDVEGFASVVTPEQAYPAHADSAVLHRTAMHGVSLYTAKLCRLLQAQALKLGWQGVRFTINDAHASMINHTPHDESLWQGLNLHWILGKPKRFGMMAGLDVLVQQGHTPHGVLLLGHHAQAMTPSGNLAHSFTNMIRRIELNGQAVGEAELNTLLAEQGFGIPLLGVLGDSVLQQQLGEWCKTLPVVATKTPLGWASALLRPWQAVEVEILERWPLPTPDAPCSQPHTASLVSFCPNEPWELVLAFQELVQAEVVSLWPYATALTGTRVRFEIIGETRQERMQHTYLTLQAAYTTALASKLIV